MINKINILNPQVYILPTLNLSSAFPPLLYPLSNGFPIYFLLLDIWKK